MLIPVKYKRPFVWLRRFRNRCGYGIHSPFAFHLITDVINEKLPYYDYSDLHNLERRLCREDGRKLLPKNESIKLRRLLYRLVNYVHPKYIVFAGEETMLFRYLKSPCKQARSMQTINGIIEMRQETHFLVYVRFGFDIARLEDICQYYIEKASADSLLVVQGIGFSTEMKTFWMRLKTNSRVGITFDLYDVGLVFFDHSKIKQDYIVNF